MPQGETFWNPYRLVPVRDRVPKDRPTPHARFTGKNGLISCTLENLTLLFIGGSHVPGQTLLKNGRPVIPGTSLKGVFRSLAEAVGGGCFITNPQGPRGYRFQDDQYKACSNVNSLCPTCRLFGMMESRAGAKVHQGLVSFSDADLLEGQEVRTKAVDILLQGPRWDHAIFYYTPTTGALDGKARKFYFHQPRHRETVLPIPDNLRRRAEPIHPLLPGHCFDFTVTFENLTDADLSLLVYVLALEEQVEVEIAEGNLRLQGPMRHKLGLGKPLGLGSCKINLNQISYLPEPEVRFATMATTRKTLEGDPLQAEVTRLTSAYVNDHSPPMEHLRRLLVWDENDPRTFRYPPKSWFDEPANKGKTLKKVYP